MDTILDMVKVMSFALEEGKVAVHCHAGLGRTGTKQDNVSKITCWPTKSELFAGDMT